MAIAGDPRVTATLGTCREHPLRISLPTSRSKVIFTAFPNRGSARNVCCHVKRNLRKMTDNKLSHSFSQEAESCILNAVNMGFFERLNLAWKIIFPPTTPRNSNASIAKQRLKMILFSDRCAVSDEAKRKIVTNIVRALSDFVEIESQDKVQLSVSTDSDIGTVYSVTVPVRRVKQEYQDEEEIGAITNIKYQDTGEQSGTVDVTFDFFTPNENGQ